VPHLTHTHSLTHAHAGERHASHDATHRLDPHRVHMPPRFAYSKFFACLPQVVELLLAAGANLSARNNEGKTPIAVSRNQAGELLR